MADVFGDAPQPSSASELQHGTNTIFVLQYCTFPVDSRLDAFWRQVASDIPERLTLSSIVFTHDRTRFPYYRSRNLRVCNTSFLNSAYKRGWGFALAGGCNERPRAAFLLPFCGVLWPAGKRCVEGFLYITWSF